MWFKILSFVVTIYVSLGICEGEKCDNPADIYPSCRCEVRFKCKYQGIFPHPYISTKFIFCSLTNNGSFVAIPQNCEDKKMAYNPRTKDCSKPLDKIPLGYHHVSCKNSDEVVALSRDPNIFYLCKMTYCNLEDEEEEEGVKVLYPEPHMCFPGTKYSVKRNGCKRSQ